MLTRSVRATPSRPTPLAHLARRARLAALRSQQADGKARRDAAAAAPIRFAAHPLQWIGRLWTRLGENRSLGLGAEMAFWLFLSLLPLAAVAGLVAARVAWGNWSLAAPLLASLPKAMRELIGTELGRVAAWNGGKVGLEAGLMFIWLSSSGIHSIFDGIELESNATPRPWWRKRVAAVGSCIALSIGVALLTVLGTGLSWLDHLIGDASWLQALHVESTLLGRLLRMGIGASVALGLLSGLYWIALPRETRRTMPIVPGALLALGLQITLGFVYGLYITRIGDGGAYQAGLASIGVTLIALYLFCLALLVGIEFNQILGERRRSTRP